MRTLGPATHRTRLDPRRWHRVPVLLAGLALALGLGAAACKSDKGDSAPPGGDGSPAGDAQTSGVTLRYKVGPTTLKKNVKGSFTLTSGRGGGSVTADLSGLLMVEPSGDALKVAYSVTEIRDYKSELPQPQQQDGAAAEPKDPKEIAMTVKGATIVNTRGEPDEDKTKALPENKRDELDPETQGIIGTVEGFLSLPELPEEPLEIGKPVKKSEERDVPGPGGLKIPSEIDTTIKLISIDDSSGKRLATLEVEVEGGGAVESQGNMISMESSAESTLVFNLDDQLPVSANVQSTNAFSFGPQGSFELAVKYESSFEPG